MNQDFNEIAKEVIDVQGMKVFMPYVGKEVPLNDMQFGRMAGIASLPVQDKHTWFVVNGIKFVREANKIKV